MRYLLTIPLLMFVAGTLRAAGSSRSFEVVVNIPANTPASEIPYITGDISGVCQWQPDCVALKKVADGTYKANLPVRTDARGFDFKVTRGAWENEAADPAGRSAPAFHVDFKEHPDLFVANVINWVDQRPLGVTGKLERLRNFYSPELNNHRDIEVWLPEFYSDGVGNYPVLYMQDGQNVFDPATSTNGVDWGVDETMTSLIERHQVKSAIVVAIHCTRDRNEEYSHYESGQRYTDFVVNTVKPYIDGHYRTRADRESTFVMGSSMGSLISLSMLWTRPDVFSRAAAVSVPAWAGDSFIQKLVFETPLPPQPIKIYMDHGTESQDARYGPAAKALYDLFLSRGVPRSSLEYEVYPYAGHSEVDWARRVAVPLKFLIN